MALAQRFGRQYKHRGPARSSPWHCLPSSNALLFLELSQHHEEAGQGDSSVDLGSKKRQVRASGCQTQV